VGEVDQVQSTATPAIETPLESLEAAYAKIRDELKAELLNRLKAEAPTIFERIVIELLVKMGYGGSRVDAAQAIGKPGDEGLVARKFKSSLAHCTVSTQLKAFSSQRRIFRETRTNMSRRSAAKSC
jgi:restriction endonuclease Mrr